MRFSSYHFHQCPELPSATVVSPDSFEAALQCRRHRLNGKTGILSHPSVIGTVSPANNDGFLNSSLGGLEMRGPWVFDAGELGQIEVPWPFVSFKSCLAQLCRDSALCLETIELHRWKVWLIYLLKAVALFWWLKQIEDHFLQGKVAWFQLDLCRWRCMSTWCSAENWQGNILPIKSMFKGSFIQWWPLKCFSFPGNP